MCSFSANRGPLLVIWGTCSSILCQSFVVCGISSIVLCECKQKPMNSLHVMMTLAYKHHVTWPGKTLCPDSRHFQYNYQVNWCTHCKLQERNSNIYPAIPPPSEWLTYNNQQWSSVKVYPLPLCNYTVNNVNEWHVTSETCCYCNMKHSYNQIKIAC